MINSIKNPGSRIFRNQTGEESGTVDGPSFSDRLSSMLKDVNTKQHDADIAAEKVIKGEMGIHEGMISLSEADISLRYLTQVRSKVMTAYNEIIKMSI